MNPGTKVTIQNETFTIRSKLSKGSSCELFKVVLPFLHEGVLKYTPFHSPSTRMRFSQEVSSLQQLSGLQNVVRLVAAEEGEHAGCLVEEFCSEGSLEEVCGRRQELEDGLIMNVLKDICCGLCQAHKRGIVHRDLRPGNILVGSDSHCRLSDFSSSTFLLYSSLPASCVPTVQEDIQANTSPVLRAPEQAYCRAGGRIDEKVDMWGLGCLLYGLLFGQSPFRRRDEEDYKVGRYRSPNRPVGEIWIRILNMLFVPDPQQRASANEILSTCIQAEIPLATTIPLRSSLSKPHPLRDLFHTSTASWVKAATSNLDAPPDPHYTSKLLTKAWLKRSKISKFYKSLASRPLHKTIVCLKALMLEHIYTTYGPLEALVDAGAYGVLTRVEAFWHAQSRQKGDKLRCGYMIGLVKKYGEVIRRKVAMHRKAGLLGEWRGELREELIGEMMEYWMKLGQVAGGVMIAGVTELPKLRTTLSSLILEEQLRLLPLLSRSLFSLILHSQSFPQLFALLTCFQQNYHNTRSLALCLKRKNQHTRCRIPVEELPEDLKKLLDCIRREENGRVRVDQEEMMRQISRYQTRNSIQTPAEPLKPPEIPVIDEKIAPVSAESKEEFVDIDLLDLHADGENEKIYSSLLSEKESRELHWLSEMKSLQFDQENGGNKEKKKEEAWGFQMGNQPNRWEINTKDLLYGPAIGQGGSCTVYKGTYRSAPVAIKVMRTGVSADLRKEFDREVAALVRIRHPNLVLFIGATLTPALTIVTELCTGSSLFSLLHQSPDISLSWAQKLKLCKDTAQGMSYLHGLNPAVIHRDLKSLNLLLFEPVVQNRVDNILVKITDFGIAKTLDQTSGLMTGLVGTCHWMAPEVITSEDYGLPADVYSYGIVLWEIACRQTPYRGIPPALIPERVVRCGERPSLTSVPSSCPAGLKDLMVKCWDENPQRRPTFSQILSILSLL